MPRRQALLETLLVFAVFFVQGAWPAPDVNEPNYLCKAVHFWNPAWAAHDFFLQTADTHWVFYFTFGWLSRWLPPTALAWLGRLLIWGLLAWAWRRLSFALAPRRWLAPLTAALFVAMIQHGNLAGEWVIGGVEAKGFAFVLVFLGLEAFVRDRWQRAWLLLGAAAAFHVLVGGWAAVAVGIAWLLLGKDHPPLRSMWLSLGGGLMLSLPGLLPPLLLNWGAKASVIRAANEIYVYERLPHHLNPWKFPLDQLIPFAVLCLVWLLVGRTAAQAESRRLRAFVVASLGIAVAGMVISLLGFWDRPLAASWLRYYWFRLADVAVPLGVALVGVRWIIAPNKTSLALGAAVPAVESRRNVRAVWLAIVVAMAAFHMADCVVMRLFSLPPHADRLVDLDAWARGCRWVAHPGQTSIFPRHPRADRLADYAAWLEACDWASQPEHISPDATFLTPRMSQTFKWYAGRGEAGTWKEVPQDAQSIIQWWLRMQAFYGKTDPLPTDRWYNSLDELGADRLRQLAATYHFDYVLTTVSKPPLPLPIVYSNRAYVIYRVKKASD